LFHPCGYRPSRCLSDFELDGAPGLLLHDGGAGSDSGSIANVTDPQFDQITGAKLAVDAKVEQGKVAGTALDLKTNSDSPDVPQPER
jgi:hypothetical protein